MATATCTIMSPDSVSCNGTVYILPEKMLTYHDEWFWIYLSIYVVLVLIAGLMSGLTMGLLSLDMMTLNVLKDGGTIREKKYANKIIPIVKHHHLLLVTLLLANAGAVEAMPIFLDKISDPIIAIAVSVSAVLVFGEVLPQAVCTKFGLAIGARLAPFVYFLLGIFFVISWPLAKILDCCLGKNHTTFFRRAELKVLVDLHSQKSSTAHQDGATEDKLTVDEVLIIQGALDMRNKTVQHAMLPLQDVFMLSIDDHFDTKTMNKVLHFCHSRIPVYDGEKTSIVGLLLIKMLIKLDPDDSTPVRELLNTPSSRNVLFVEEDMFLFDLLNIFQTGKCHLAVVKKMKSVVADVISPVDTSDTTPLLADSKDDITIQVTPSDDQGQVTGIITLEDVIEELIQEEIFDETDIYVDIHKRIQVAKARTVRQLSHQKVKIQRSHSHPPLLSQHGRVRQLSLTASTEMAVSENIWETAGRSKSTETVSPVV